MTDTLAINDNEPQSKDMETVVRGFLADGEIINAIKYVRSAATLNLANAKIYVDSIAAKIRDEGIVGEGRKYLKQSEIIASLQDENARLRAFVKLAATHDCKGSDEWLCDCLWKDNKVTATALLARLPPALEDE